MDPFRSLKHQRLTWLGVAAVAAVAALVGAAQPASASATGQIRHADAPDAIPGSYLVVYRDSAVAAEGVPALTRTLANRHQAKVSHVYGSALRGFAARMSQTQARRLAAHPAVAYMAQDAVVRASAEQLNPPSWGLDRIDQGGGRDSRYVYDTTASNVHVYVIDTGIRVSHTTFGGRASWAVNTTGDGNNTDCNGHGTHVAGTVGGSAYGVAKGVRLHAVKVLTCSGSGSFAGVVAGVDWVTNNKIRPAVANMSLGGGVYQPLDDAIRNSTAAGVTYVVAAGNWNDDACNYSPARAPQALTVGATNINDARASFSNWGRCVDLFAPGESITSAWNSSDTASSSLSGTSMASPHVAGAAALYLAANPGASASTVHNHVWLNATLDRLTSIGSGSPNRMLFSRTIAPRTGTNVLYEGGTLYSGQYLRSNVGNHELLMQSDGNLVHYQRGKALWAAGLGGIPGNWAIMQTDGNFVIYNSAGRALWATNTGGSAATHLMMQDDGNIVLYGPNGSVFWHSR